MVAVHAFVMKPKAEFPVSQGWHGHIEPPNELVQLRAYEKFEQRGWVAGNDWADWFAAEEELRTLFAMINWVAEWQPGNPPYLALVAKGPNQVLSELCRYFRTCPDSTTRLDGRVAPWKVIWPMSRIDSTPTAEDVEAARSPVLALSADDFSRLRGHLVALLLTGDEKGKVIASAPLDLEHPEIPRRQIKKQIASSSYKNSRYQLRQILEDATAS